MKIEKRGCAKEVFQIANHRARTPLSIVIHELEHLIHLGNLECKQALTRALEISEVLGSFANLTDYDEAKQNTPLTSLLASSVKSYPVMQSKLHCKTQVKARPKQLGAALHEIFGIFFGKSPLLSEAFTSSQDHSLHILGTLLCKPTLTPGKIYTSLADVGEVLLPHINPIIKVVDEALKDNNIAFAATWDKKYLNLTLEFEAPD